MEQLLGGSTVGYRIGPKECLSMVPSQTGGRYRAGYRRAQSWAQCKNGIRKTKAENELRLARQGKSNKKAFFSSVHSKRQRKERLVQLLNEDDKLITDDKVSEQYDNGTSCPGRWWALLPHWRHSRCSWTVICQRCFEVDSCNAQGVGLDGLVSPFQLYYSMIL